MNLSKEYSITIPLALTVSAGILFASLLGSLPTPQEEIQQSPYAPTESIRPVSRDD